MLTSTRTRILCTTALSLTVGLVISLPLVAQDATVKRGMQVYAAQKCSTCHLIAGKGKKTGPLDDVGSKLSGDEIRQWIVNPTEMAAKAKSKKKPPMENKYSKLPPADIDALVAYMQTLKK